MKKQFILTLVDLNTGEDFEQRIACIDENDAWRIGNRMAIDLYASLEEVVDSGCEVG
jgi:hypothetical protein